MCGLIILYLAFIGTHAITGWTPLQWGAQLLGVIIILNLIAVILTVIKKPFTKP